MTNIWVAGDAWGDEDAAVISRTGRWRLGGSSWAINGADAVLTSNKLDRQPDTACCLLDR